MERLTKTYSDGTHGASDNLPCGENSYTYKGLLLEALGKYEDADEQGLLLRLPCGIGADVYFIPSETNFKLNILNDKLQFNRVYHQNVARITFIRNGWYMECDKDLQYAIGNILVDKMYKETWFLSQAEAEQKLKEIGGENEID